jgi:putative ABC transport system permease protein
MFDLKYAWRLLIKSWGYSLLCIGVVALSLGLALWAYALVYSQALKPLDMPGSERWYSVQIAKEKTSLARPAVDAYTYQQMMARGGGVDHLGAFVMRNVLVSEGEASVSLRAADISPGLFTATGAKPLLGRMFESSDSDSNGAPVAILSYDTWKNYFAGDRGILGRQTRIDAQLVQIVGVMPEGMHAFHDFELWMPLQPTHLVQPTDSDAKLAPFIVVGDGQSKEAVAGALQAVVRDVNQGYPNLFNTQRNVQLIPARLMSTHSLLSVVSIISLLALAILVLGCVNIGLVFLARLLERSRELALRAALGASHGRLMRQSLLETALMVLAGLIVGFALAAGGVEWAQGIGDFTARIQAAGRPSNPLMLRTADLAVAALIAIMIWLLSTLVPARKIASQDASIALAGSGKGSAGHASSKSTMFLVGLQVLISSIVLVLCGNLVLAVNAEANKPSGIDVERVVVTTAPTSFDDRYAEPSRRLAYWNDLQASVATKIPGTQVAFATALPSLPKAVSVDIEASEGDAGAGGLTLPLVAVSEAYFDLLGVTLRSGRLFDSTDNASSLLIALVDEKTASRYWPGQNAIGKRIQLNPADNGPWLTVIGVVSAVAGAAYRNDNGVVYRPLRQALPDAFHVLAKLPEQAGTATVALRAAAFEVDRNLALHNPQTLDDYLTSVDMDYKSMIPVLAVITLITVLLAATGLFGLISRSVAQRTQEVGIRRALGATPWQSISMFLRQGWIYLGISEVGMAIGVVFTSLASSEFANILDNVVPVTLGVLMLMVLVIFLAAYLPARRALVLEPGDALRYQ